MQKEEIVKLSGILSDPLEKLYKAGGFSLVFIFTGLICMVFGHFYQGQLSAWIFTVGALMSTAFFLFLVFIFASSIK
jgi:hypothetical protein